MSIRVTVPFSQVPEWVVDHEEAGLSHAAVRLYAILQRYGNSPDAVRVPSRATLARRLGVSVDTVDRMKAELVEAGALEVIHRPGTSNEYVLNTGDNPKEPQACGSRTSAASGMSAEGGAADVRPNREVPTESSVPPNGGTGDGTGQSFVGWFVDESRRVNDVDPLPNAKGRLGRAAAKLSEHGVTSETIKAAITEVVEAGLNIGALESVTDQFHRGGFRGHRRPTIGMGSADLLALAGQLEEDGR